MAGRDSVTLIKIDCLDTKAIEKMTKPRVTGNYSTRTEITTQESGRTTKRMATEYLHRRRERDTRADGRTTSKMASEKNTGPMVAFSRDILLGVRNTAKGGSSSLIPVYTRENLSRTILMGSGNFRGQAANPTLEDGLEITCMEKES